MNSQTWRVSNELANLVSSHSDLAKLAGICTAPSRLDKALEDTRIGDRKDIEIVLGNLSAILSR